MGQISIYEKQTNTQKSNRENRRKNGKIFIKMTDIEILKQAMGVALKNGWKHFGFELALGLNIKLTWSNEDWERFIKDDHHYSILFNNEFARAFWGEHPDINNGKRYDAKIKIDGKIYWQYHLQQITLKKNKLKYIEKFL